MREGQELWLEGWVGATSWLALNSGPSTAGVFLKIIGNYGTGSCASSPSSLGADFFFMDCVSVQAGDLLPDAM